MVVVVVVFVCRSWTCGLGQSKAHTSLIGFPSTVIALLAILFVTTNSVWVVLYLRQHQCHFSFTSQAPDATDNTKDSSHCMQQP